MKQAYPQAEVLGHPECPVEVVSLADYILSTEKMFLHIANTKVSEFIIATETGILHRMRKKYPDRLFIPASEKAACPNMKKITLEKILISLKNMEHEIRVSEEISSRARAALRPLIE